MTSPSNFYKIPTPHNPPQQPQLSSTRNPSPIIKPPRRVSRWSPPVYYILRKWQRSSEHKTLYLQLRKKKLQNLLFWIYLYAMICGTMAYRLSRRLLKYAMKKLSWHETLNNCSQRIVSVVVRYLEKLFFSFSIVNNMRSKDVHKICLRICFCTL